MQPQSMSNHQGSLFRMPAKRVGYSAVVFLTSSTLGGELAVFFIDRPVCPGATFDKHSGEYLDQPELARTKAIELVTVEIAKITRIESFAALTWRALIRPTKLQRLPMQRVDFSCAVDPSDQPRRSITNVSSRRPPSTGRAGTLYKNSSSRVRLARQSTAAGHSGPFLPLTVSEECFARLYRLAGMLGHAMCKVPLIGVIPRNRPYIPPCHTGPANRDSTRRAYVGHQ